MRADDAEEINRLLGKDNGLKLKGTRGNAYCQIVIIHFDKSKGLSHPLHLSYGGYISYSAGSEAGTYKILIKFGSYLASIASYIQYLKQSMPWKIN